MIDYAWDFCLPIFAETHRAGHIFHCKDDLRPAPKQETPLLRVDRTLGAALANFLDLTQN